MRSRRESILLSRLADRGGQVPQPTQQDDFAARDSRLDGHALAHGMRLKVGCSSRADDLGTIIDIVRVDTDRSQDIAGRCHKRAWLHR